MRSTSCCRRSDVNRFLPTPEADTIYVGDGDFRAIGVEFLRHFVELGRLRQTDRVLDIGCGIGRMALPMTQYLDPAHGTYEGLDPVATGVEWCLKNITPAYPNFRFHRLDIANELYNPDGCVGGNDLSLAFANASFDFVLMTSVVTHLPASEVRCYFREVSRMLAPGGRFFLSAFVMDEKAQAAETLSGLKFRRGNRTGLAR